MSHGYRAVGWTPHKKLYDAVLAGGTTAFLALFVAAGLALDGNATAETQLIRALGTCALLLLHVILAIGPLARLDSRFLPLLYNRRHLGVTMFLVALGHAVFATVQFHALGDVHPLVSVLVSNTRYASVSQFPFETLGLVALLILFAMAATSHDFWLANLTAPVWKSLHMLVYVAYASTVLHVALGVLQAERHPALAALLGVGVVSLAALHVAAGWRERFLDREAVGDGAERRVRGGDAGGRDAFVEVCRVSDIREKRARIVTLQGERVAVFRHDGRISAISNVCQHQNGPLGEGRIVDGCVTCPWHGYQYLPETGASPPPFTEKVPTFRVRVEGDSVLVDPRPNPPGTRVEPAGFAPIARSAGADRPSASPPVESADELYVGYLPAAPPRTARFLRRVVPALCLAAAALALALAALQGPFDPGIFEYGRTRVVEGVLRERPYPLLADSGAPVPVDGGEIDAVVVDSPAAGRGGALLVGVGKHGAAGEAAGFDGRRVRLEATLIESPLGTVLELAAGSLEAVDDGILGDGAAGAAGAPRAPAANADAAAAAGAAAATVLGRVEVTGEIVDSKCFLGVMKPGRGKPHRACAARCLAGGIPPQLLVEAADGSRRVLLLATEAGGPLAPAAFLDLVGEAVTARGVVERSSGLMVLRVDREGLRRASLGP